MKRLSIALGIFAVAGLVLWLSRPADPVNTISDLQALVVSEQKRLGKLVYKPAVEGKIDDLDIDAVTLLRGLPNVAEVTSNGVKKPTARIVHVLDWHWASFEDFTEGHPELKGKALESAYQAFLLKVELVQIEQTHFLGCLSAHHGLAAIFSEGLSLENVEAYKATVGDLKDKEELLPFGSPAHLLSRGFIKAVLPLEDSRLLEAGKSLVPGDVAAREKAIVANVMGMNDKGGLIVLGGGHDLTRHLPAGVEYLRVAGKWQKKFAKE